MGIFVVGVESADSTADKFPRKFVIHEHHASRLHYDLRLEMDGVLKSWAVPKEPSTDPAVKRLAVAVDDHGLSYASFEGEIPAGNYGAGQVKIWDNGNYALLERESGKLVFRLEGKKLRGAFCLIRLKGGKMSSSAGQLPNEAPLGKYWLFFKKKE